MPVEKQFIKIRPFLQCSIVEYCKIFSLSIKWTFLNWTLVQWEYMHMYSSSQ